jgi:hypothetical protein
MSEQAAGPEAALRWICVGAGVLIAWAGIQVAAIAVGNVRPQMALSHGHVRANASVLGVRWERRDMGRKKGTGVGSSSFQPNDFVNICYVRFHFAADGHDVEREVESSVLGSSDPDHPPYRTGELLPVIYRPHHPEYAVVDATSSIWGPIIAPGAAALLLFIFAGALFYIFRLMSRESS